MAGKDEDILDDDENQIDPDLDPDGELSPDDDEIEDEFEDDIDDDGESDDDDDGESEDDPEAPAALDELEAEELDIVDETESSQTMLVDEASEIRAIRREELTMDVEGDGDKDDEFVCQSCFLMLNRTQLANKRKMLCGDCA